MFNLYLDIIICCTSHGKSKCFVERIKKTFDVVEFIMTDVIQIFTMSEQV